MTVDEETKIRAYAAGDMGWKSLSDQGMSYSSVLARLGELGLRPPTVRENGPNHAAIERGRARLRAALVNARP